MNGYSAHKLYGLFHFSCFFAKIKVSDSSVMRMLKVYLVKEIYLGITGYLSHRPAF